jgi:hypothetical protein
MQNKSILMLIFSLILLVNVVSAINVSDQGTNVIDKTTNNYLTFGDLEITITKLSGS